jgi:hypothetical protein
MNNRHRFTPGMEASCELRPCADETPGSRAHHHRCARPVSKQSVKTEPQITQAVQGGESER